MNGRDFALAAGLVALGIGAASVLAPGALSLDFDEALVVLVGGLALARAARVAQLRRRRDRDEASTPDPELPAAMPTPGDDLAAVFRRFPDAPRTYHEWNRTRNGLRAAAVATLAEYRTGSRTEAIRQVQRGEWTDDPAAASFVGDRDVRGPPLRARVRRAISGDSAFGHGIARTVDAIAETAGVAPRATDGVAGDRTDRAEDASVPRHTTDGELATTDGRDRLVTRALHATGHWEGVRLVALVGVGVGVVLGRPAPLLAGVVGVGFAAYARSSALPPGPVSVERSLGDDRPDPGDDVEVTVTVTNETDRVLPDLRLVDGVPTALAVADGSPRLGTALRPNRSATFSYTVAARRGVHGFGPTLVVARDLPGSREQETLVAEATELTCVPTYRACEEPLALRQQASRYVGRVETERGGEGVEFYATRDYRPGDAMSRVDWNRRARTGELATVEYREERAATVVLVVDAREAAYLAPSPTEPHAVDRAVDAAGRLYETLTAAGDRVGVAGFGAADCWLAPGTGPDHAVRARELLGTHPGLGPVPAAEQSPLRRARKRLRERLPTDAQVVFLTPLCDETGSRVARSLEAAGHPVTVLSPDPTAGRTSGHRLARVGRALRTTKLRAAGVPVVDWRRDESLDAALARYEERSP